jgi:hypothetical protein
MTQQTDRMLGGNPTDELCEVESVERTPFSKSRNGHMREDPDEVLTWPSEKDHMQGFVRSSGSQPLIRAMTVLAGRGPVDEAAVNDEANRHTRFERFREFIPVARVVLVGTARTNSVAAKVARTDATLP